MNSKQILAVAMAGILTMALTGEVAARGGYGGGRGGGQCNMTRTQTQTQAQNRAMNRSSGDSSVTRPADSRRRDGTFLSTGVTANGSTSRPGYGQGLQDGSRLNATPAPPVTTE